MLLRFHCKGSKVEYTKLDEETSMVFLEYLHAQFGKRSLTIAPDAPIWVSTVSKTGARKSVCKRFLAFAGNHLEQVKTMPYVIHLLRVSCV